MKKIIFGFIISLFFVGTAFAQMGNPYNQAGMSDKTFSSITTNELNVNGVLTVSPDGTNEVLQVNDGSIDFTDGNAGTTGTLTIDTSGNWSYSQGFTTTSLTTSRTALPAITFRDSDGTDSDDNGQIYGDLTDTGSGTEDFDMYFRQQVAGTMTTFIYADADGNLELGGSAQPVEIKGKLILSTAEVTCSDTTDTCAYNASIYQHWLTAGTDATDDTLTLSAGVEGQEVNFIHCGGTDDVVIDASTGTDTTLSSGESVTYIYRSSNTTWYIK